MWAFSLQSGAPGCVGVFPFSGGLRRRPGCSTGLGADADRAEPKGVKRSAAARSGDVMSWRKDLAPRPRCGLTMLA